MKKFVFKLDVLLKMRKRLEDQAQTKLTNERRSLQQEKIKLFDLQDLRVNAQAEFEEQKNKHRVYIQDLLLWNEYLSRIDKKIEQQTMVITEQEEVVKKALKTLEEAIKKRKVVEMLKEKRLQHYNLELLAQEQIILDELSLSIFTRT